MIFVVSFSVLYYIDLNRFVPLIGIFFLVSAFCFWVTLEKIGEYLGFVPLVFSILTFIEIGTVLLLIYFEVNPFTLLVFGFSTVIYLFLTVGSRFVMGDVEKNTKRLLAERRQMLEAIRRRELGQTESDEEQKDKPDFSSEENLEAQGISSSAEMDLEDMEV